MSAGGVYLTHVGGPTVLIEIGDLRLLTDPTFDAAGSSYVVESVGLTLRKTAAPAMGPETLGRLDAVLLSHDEHADNFDVAGRRLAAAAPIVLTTRGGALRLGGNARGLAPFESMRLGDLTIAATPARHGPPGCEPLLGDVVGFLLSREGRPDVYVSGDTVLYDDVRAIGAGRTIGTALLNLGAVAGPDGARFTMSAADGAEAARALGARRVVPVHVEGWEHFAESRAEAEAAFAHAADVEVRWLDPGVRTRVPD